MSFPRPSSTGNARSWAWCAFMLASMISQVTAQQPPVQTQPKESLPSEAQLPAEVVTQPPTEQVLPGSKPQPEVPGANISEAVLPGGLRVANVGADGTDLTGQLRPWLRLALDGHTGVIRSLSLSSDGKLLASGGEDKDLHVWSPQETLPVGWFHRRTVRWPVVRGPRGRIYSVASRGNEVAMAGHGADGKLGEIWIVDAVSGDLTRTLVDETSGHRQVITSLAWARDGSAQLVSSDITGKLILWQPNAATGLWTSRVLVDEDRVTYGEAFHDVLKHRRVFGPVTWVGNQTVVTTRYTGVSQNGALVWKLHLINLANGASTVIDDIELLEYAIAFDSTADGSRIIVSDAFGNTMLIMLAADGSPASKMKLDVGHTPLALKFNDDGSRLLVSSVVSVDDAGVGKSVVQWWNTQAVPPVKLSEMAFDDHVRSIVWQAAGRQAIAAVGNRLVVLDIDANDKFVEPPRGYLQVPAKPIQRVAFSNNSESYAIAIATERDAAGNSQLSDVFELDEVRLLPRARLEDADYLPAQRLAARWTMKASKFDQGRRYQLFEDDQPRGVLPLIEEIHGPPTAIATLEVTAGDDETGNIIIVGSGGRNNIYVYAADATNPPRLLRQFRGHQGEVLSLSTSADGSYLASGSSDTMIGVWKLDDVLTASETENRWGVQFEIENADGGSGQLLAAEVREDGPLYFRGVRSGDRLIGIKWSSDDGSETFAENDATKMLQQLRTLPFDALVVFEFTRRGRPLPGFQSFAAWQPIATLFVDTTREWAMWTPAGFYNASFNGHLRFGWQINRGVNQLPDYFRAAQFRELLERPATMRRLLKAGSLEAAMRESVSGIGPPPGETAIVNQYRSKPRIQVIQPQPGEVLQGDEVEVIANITIPSGASLVDFKVFASGVPALDREIIADQMIDDQRVATYRWKLRLPSDSRIQLELVAATEASAIDRVVLDYEHQTDHPPRMPRLHVLAIGISEYRDRQIQSLDFASRATDVIANLFQKSSSPLYRVTTDQLVDADATRPMWRVYAEQAAKELAKTVSPDDLVVMYLCGHGLRDRLTGQWYFVTADARYNDLMNDRYGDCLSFNDLAALSQLPCRKLAILDSCHSGAVQTLMRPDDLKSALRFLQDDVVLTITASEGDEEAAEQRETKLGRFTTELVAALNGDADRDGNGDGIVSLREAIDYVSQKVTQASEREGASQHPTASPEYLLQSLHLPLTAVGVPAALEQRLVQRQDQHYHKLRDGLGNCRVKFEREKTGRIAFLGGSITASKGWRDETMDYFKKRFPETEFDFISAGVSSLGSVPHAFRLERDVLARGPLDLLFVEAAVNDTTNTIDPHHMLRGMEGVVRHVRMANPLTDIVHLHFVMPEHMADYNQGVEPQSIVQHERVAAAYGNVTLNLSLEVTERINAGEFTWDEDFKNLHPSTFGHKLYSDSIARLLEIAFTRELPDQAKPHLLPETSIDPQSYYRGHFGDIADARIVKGFSLEQSWMPEDGKGTRAGFVNVPALVAMNPGDEFAFEFDGSGVGLFVTAGPDAGRIQYSIDGGDFSTIDTFTQWSPNLHLPWAVILADELSHDHHSVNVRIANDHDPQSVGTTLRVFHLLLN